MFCHTMAVHLHFMLMVHECFMLMVCVVFGFSVTFNLLNLSAASVCSRMNYSTQSISDGSLVSTSAHFSCSLYGTSLINFVRRLP